MNENSKVITALCSHIGAKKDSIVPLEPREWGKLAADLNHNGLQPVDLPVMSDDDMNEKLQLDHETIERIHRLLDRAPSLTFEIEKLENRGIRIVTRADKEYPRILKKKLASKCPPLFYTAGDLSLCNHKTVGFVGSRNVSADDLEFTKSTVHKVLQAGYGVVSGGAKGIDQISMQEALLSGGRVICYAADSLLRKIKDKTILQGIMDGRIVLLSVAKPDAGFNVGMAMMRNKYIYAQSDGTIVVRSDKGKGGTWAGAVENLASDPVWCLPFCWDKDYEGNQALIERGCIPIDMNWDADLKKAREQYRIESEKSSVSEGMRDTIVAETELSYGTAAVKSARDEAVQKKAEAEDVNPETVINKTDAENDKGADQEKSAENITFSEDSDPFFQSADSEKSTGEPKQLSMDELMEELF